MIANSLVLLHVFIIYVSSGVTSVSGIWNYQEQDLWPQQCLSGKHQSPIALDDNTAVETNFSPFRLENYDEIYMAKIRNNGHTVQIRLHSQTRPKVTGGGLPADRTFVLDSMHFHWDSEHTIEGERFPLELHLVHYDIRFKDLDHALQQRDAVAVLAVLFHLSPDDDSEFSDLYTTIGELKKARINEDKLLERLDLGDVLPRDRAGFFRYDGSLTTPNCTEGVIWTVFDDTLPISHRQLKIFQLMRAADNKPLLSNYRSMQEINERTVYVKQSPNKPDNSADTATVPTSLKLLIGFYFLSLLN